MTEKQVEELRWLANSNFELTRRVGGLVYTVKLAPLADAALSLREQRNELPKPSERVRLALMVILSHVEPGWENCKAVVSSWLAAAPSAGRGEGK